MAAKAGAGRGGRASGLSWRSFVVGLLELLESGREGVECELDFHTQTGAGTGCSQHTERAAQAAVKLLKLYLLSHSQLS